MRRKGVMRDIEEDVRREDGLDPWGYPEIIDEYAPAQIHEGTTRTHEPVCKSCWTVLTADPCVNCGRPQNMPDVEWYRSLFPLVCTRCGHELKGEDEGGCPECGEMAAAA